MTNSSSRTELSLHLSFPNQLNKLIWTSCITELNHYITELNQLHRPIFEVHYQSHLLAISNVENWLSCKLHWCYGCCYHNWGGDHTSLNIHKKLAFIINSNMFRSCVQIHDVEYGLHRSFNKFLLTLALASILQWIQSCLSTAYSWTKFKFRNLNESGIGRGIRMNIVIFSSAL